MGKKKLLRGTFTFEGKRYYVSEYSRTEVEVSKTLRRKELEEQTLPLNQTLRCHSGQRRG